MSQRVTRDSATEHAWATEVIFECLNGTLPGEDLARFETHIARCDECRSDINFEQTLVRGMHERQMTDYVPHGSLQVLNGRIDRFEKRRGSRRVRLSESGTGRLGSATVRWLLAGQAAAIAVLAIALFIPASPPQVTEGYQTLSSSADRAPAGAQLQVVFDDSLSTAELRALLVGLDATIVRGPTRAGLFEIEIAPTSPVSPANAVEALRANRHVVFATPSEGRN